MLIMTTTTQWEYCELLLSDQERHKAGMFGGSEGWSFECAVYFYGDTGRIKFQQLAELKQAIAFNPFKKAMAVLGLRGWELVSVQQASFGARARSDGSVSYDQRVAYFKRPVVAGRSESEPELVL
jgi:hypothetical protein